MSKKQKTIFIVTFITVGLIIILAFFWFNKGDKSVPTEEVPWYQQFNPFGSSTNTGETPGGGGIDIDGKNKQTTMKSRFFKITDFAVSGVTYTDEKTLIEDSVKPKEIQVQMDPLTKEGRIKIQGFLNKTLGLEKPLVENGTIDQATTEAIKQFQKEKSLTVTGKIDKETSIYFTETKIEPGVAQYEILPAIRYVERKNGHLYKMLLKDLVPEKISNSTIPSIYESYFNKDGNTTIYRYLSNEDVVSTFLATLGKASGEYLPSNITDLSVSKDKNRFFYITKSNNSVVGVVQNFETGAKQNVLSHQFTEWLSDWDNNKNIYLTTKATYGLQGSVYVLNQKQKTITKIFGSLNGLTTQVSPDGKRILYSVANNSGPELYVYISEGRKFLDLNNYGLSEKCIWSSNNVDVYCAIPATIKGNQYPDVWYQGLISFDDYFVKIDTNSGQVDTLADSNNETVVDATNLLLDKNEEHLFFINKKDYTLWGLNL